MDSPNCLARRRSTVTYGLGVREDGSLRSKNSWPKGTFGTTGVPNSFFFSFDSLTLSLLVRDQRSQRIRKIWQKSQPVSQAPRLMSVTVADLTLLDCQPPLTLTRGGRERGLGHPSAATVLGGSSSMPDASFDLETTRLAARAQAGDADAFNTLIDLHHRAARRVALAAVGNLADADEAVQEACLTAWRRLDRLADPAAFRAWLLRITWRKALDRRRTLTSWLKRIRRDQAEDQDPLEHIAGDAKTPDEALLARERDRVVAQLIRSLPPRLRDPFLLAASGEHRYEDIAVLLGIPLGTVKWRMLEARRVLREKLERLGFGESV